MWEGGAGYTLLIVHSRQRRLLNDGLGVDLAPMAISWSAPVSDPRQFLG